MLEGMKDPGVKFIDQKVKELLMENKIMVFKSVKLVMILITVLVAVSMLLPENKSLRYTVMDTPGKDSPPAMMMAMLQRLEETDVWGSLSEYALSESSYEEFARLTARENQDPKKGFFDMAATTDMCLRSIIGQGYSYRINWPEIKYVGVTAVMPRYAEEVDYTLYFEDQDRIFAIKFKGAVLSGEGEHRKGIFMEDYNLKQIDSDAVGSIGNIIKKLLN